jgi:hypothetical protein
MAPRVVATYEDEVGGKLYLYRLDDGSLQPTLVSGEKDRRGNRLRAVGEVVRETLQEVDAKIVAGGWVRRSFQVEQTPAERSEETRARWRESLAVEVPRAELGKWALLPRPRR